MKELNGKAKDAKCSLEFVRNELKSKSSKASKNVIKKYLSHGKQEPDEEDGEEGSESKSSSRPKS